MKQILSILLALGATNPLTFAESPVGVVSQITVLSDKVEDVSSLEAWKRSFIRDGMSDQEKAMAVWTSVVKFQHQDQPPNEYLQVEDMVLDPIKGANVYGYSFCSVASAHVQSLARYAGLEARGWTLRGHMVPEVKWDGRWHLLDASLLNYFPQADGQLAGVEEIVAGVKEWYEANPKYKGDEDKLRAFMRGGGWRNAPAVLARSPAYDDNGWLPAATHGWYSTMIEYSGTQGTPFPYKSGYSNGYRVNLQLRAGEVLVRNWSNKGLHVNMDESGPPGAMVEKVGAGGLRYSPKFGDLAPGRLGNGTLAYELPLASGEFRSGALAAVNLSSNSEAGTGPAIHVNDASQPGVLEIRMPSSYVYLGGELAFDAVVGSGGRIAVAFSENNGLDWKEIASSARSGEQSIDLKPLVFRRYDYRLRFTLHGAGTGLDSVKVRHDIQHSQRPLPALAAGDNTITYSAGNEGTITVEGSTQASSAGRQLRYTDFHPQLAGIDAKTLKLAGGQGSVTLPISTPGEMKRLRVNLFYRLRDARDLWQAEVSFDAGKTFKPVAEMAGPTVGSGRSILVDQIPRGARSALVRLNGTQRNTAMIYNLRIDADYEEPHGGFRPVIVTYRWQENGVEMSEERVIDKADQRYVIHCDSKPSMTSISLQLALTTSR